MKPSTEELVVVQRDLEDESRAIGQARYRANRSSPWVDAFGPLKDEASLPPGRHLLRQAGLPTAAAIRSFLEAASSGKAGRLNVAWKLLEAFEPNPEELAVLTLRCCIQAAAQSLRAQTAASMVSAAVMDHLKWAQFAKGQPNEAAALQKAVTKKGKVTKRRQEIISKLMAAKGHDVPWSQIERMHVGMKLIEIACEATDFFDVELQQTYKNGKPVSHRHLQLTDKVQDWLDKQHERCELLDPLPLPMVVPPRPWTNTSDGGYLQPPIGNRLVNSPCKPYREELDNVELDRVFAAVNYIQGIGWRINRRLLAVMDEIYVDGGGLAGFPSAHPEALPPRPSEADIDPEVERKWKWKRAEVHQRNASAKSKRTALAQQLWVSRKLRDFPAIYFPHHLDWRGRVYVTPQAGPHPQANDTGRSLLEFAEGKPLGARGAFWLAVHVANTFGQDKISFEDRLAWVEANEAAILDSANDPLDGKRFWADVDKPWAALAACFEWAGYKAEGVEFVSRLPIALDGTNSGLQHLTALVRDAVTAPKVNLVETDKPGDLYKQVAEKAQQIVDATSDPKAAPWKNGKIIRRLTKRPCMTFVFSVTARSMADQILKELNELDAECGSPYLEGADNFQAAVWLGPQIYRLIKKEVPYAAKAMAWLQDASKLVSKAALPLWWTSPAGLPVLQRYIENSTEKVNVQYRGKRMQLEIASDNQSATLLSWLENPASFKIDAQAANNGIAPNFVHSLDAAHLMLTALEAEKAGFTGLAVIHDSFGTHASDTDKLSDLLRQTFVSMYESDPMTSFRDEVLSQLERDDLAALLPAPPPVGQLDLQDVLRASYMFA